MAGRELEITFGDQRAAVVELGGGLRAYSVGDRPLVDGFPPGGEITSGRGQVLIPWPNRLEDGTYEFAGRRHELPLTEPERRNAIHGLVRWARWSVGERDESRVVLERRLEPQPGYPFALALRIEYALAGEGLTVRTTATNVGEQPCPFGAGAHPYLSLGTDAVDSLVLRAPGRSVLRADARGLPTGSAPVDGTEYDFRAPRRIGATVLDHCFTDLEREDGRARVELRAPAGSGVALWLDDAYGYLMLFTGDPLPDVARRSLAVEPMTCAPNAFRSGAGLVVLAPGESWAGAWGISSLP
jgi:aldose 1-epimerase